MSQSIGHLSLWGDFEPDEITNSLGLQPSAVYPKGDTLEGADCPAKVTTWDFYCPDDLTAVEQVRFLVDLLRPSADVLRHLSKKYTAAFNVSCEDDPVFSLSAGDIQELANLGVQLNSFMLLDEAGDKDMGILARELDTGSAPAEDLDESSHAGRKGTG